jgi:hypothetical protein
MGTERNASDGGPWTDTTTTATHRFPLCTATRERDAIRLCYGLSAFATFRSITLYAIATVKIRTTQLVLLRAHRVHECC